MSKGQDYRQGEFKGLQECKRRIEMKNSRGVARREGRFRNTITGRGGGGGGGGGVGRGRGVGGAWGKEGGGGAQLSLQEGWCGR